MVGSESNADNLDLNKLSQDIKSWGKALGFQHVGISDVNLKHQETRLQAWLDSNYHGDMTFMAEHGMKRARPHELIPGTLTVVSVRLNYLPPDASFAKHLSDSSIGYISRYALGRDYHKVLRNKLKKLGQRIQQVAPNALYRPFTDSAPVLEHAIAEKAGVGWTGKHSLTLSKDGGSWFFLGELFLNLELPTDKPVQEGCGSCTACISMCPTNAIVAPYQVDARKCISYLTIEYNGIIPEQYRQAMGNRIYGCDDCQLVCPWNRYAQVTDESDFNARENLHGKSLLELFSWTEELFLKFTEGGPIRRIGFNKWQRNIAVALGNADYSEDILEALTAKNEQASELVKPHIEWAIVQQQQKYKQQVQKSRHTDRLIRIVNKGLPRDA